MSRREMLMFMETVRKAINTPSPSNPDMSIWETVAAIHNQNRNAIHNGATFLFWHRAFLYAMEKELQKLNSDFFFPYWDSSREFQVQSWQKSIAMRLTDLSDTKMNIKRDLRRNDLIASSQWSNLLQQSIQNRQGFQYFAPSPQMELLHGTLHVSVGGNGGDMSTMNSPRDPLFFLHHGHLDYMWSSAQVEWARRGLPQVGSPMPGSNVRSTLESPLPAFSGNTFGDVLDMSRLCVQYAPPSQQSNLQSNNSTSDFATNTNFTCSPIPESWFRMNGLPIEHQTTAVTECQNIAQKMKIGVKFPPIPTYNQTEYENLVGQVIPETFNFKAPTSASFVSIKDLFNDNTPIVLHHGRGDSVEAAGTTPDALASSAIGQLSSHALTLICITFAFSL